MPLTRNQRDGIIAALGASVAQQLISLLDAQGPAAGPVVPSLINNNPPVYAADTNYTKTIDGVNVIHLTVNAIKTFWGVTLSLLPKHIHLLQEEGITYP